MSNPWSLPPENVARGTVFALAAVPFGVMAWVVLWGANVIASIVALGVAVLAAFLYRFGSRGRIGWRGAFIVMGITWGTLAVAFFAGLAFDVANAISRVTGLTVFESFSSEFFSDAFGQYWDVNGGVLLVNILVAIGFGLLGTFGVLRSVFAQAKADRTIAQERPDGFE